jgi:hypothetical protein
MERTVSGLFMDKEHAQSAVGALRADGIDAKRITLASPEGTVVGGETQESHGIGGWFAEHLLHRTHSQEQAQQVKEQVTAAGWLVTVSIRTDEEDRSARNVFVTAGATELSSLAEGTMVPVERPVGAGVAHQ